LINDLNKIYDKKRRRDCNLDIYTSLKHDYVYFMVCKSASSTVTHHLRFAEYHGTQFTVQNVNSVYMSPLLMPFQFKDGDFIDILNDRKFRKFSFVRNPYTRILSCYLHRIIGERRANPSKAVLYQQTDFSDTNKPSFEEFLAFISNQKPNEMERHWAIQSDAMLYDEIEFDFIGKQETLIDDLLALEKLIYGRDIFDRTALASVNLAPKVTNAGEKLGQYYTTRATDLLRECYERDFVNFGYSTSIENALGE